MRHLLTSISLPLIMYDNDYASKLKKLPNYAAQQQLSSLIRWKLSAEGGHELVLKNSAEQFLGVAVVQVFDYKLNCSPNGNYVNTKFGSLETAKFQFYAGRAADANFGSDFDNVYTNLDKLQSIVAGTKDQRDMLYKDSSEKMIRFARTIFEKRVSSLPSVSWPNSPIYRQETTLPDSPRPVYYQDVVEHNFPSKKSETIDDKTKNWPIDLQLQDKLDLIKPSYRAVPLPVYENGIFVELAEVNNRLRNALVEIQFSVHHLLLRNQSPPRDSFRANIEQIIILKHGKPTRSSRPNPRAGPISAIPKRSEWSDTDTEETTHATKKPRTTQVESEMSTNSKGKEKERITEEEIMKDPSSSKGNQTGDA